MSTRSSHVLSPSQETLWFLAQMGPVASAAYNVVSILRFDGRLDPAALERAIAATAERQEVLRASFIDVGGQPRMEIAAKYSGRLERRRLPDSADPDRAAQAVAAELATLPFDLTRPPLLRTVLLETSDAAGEPAAEGPFYLLTIAHHTIFDGWSLGIFLREVQAFYRAEQRGQRATLPPLRATFRQLVESDRERQESPEFHRSLDQCKRRLEGAPALLELPVDRPRPASKAYAGSLAAIDGHGLTVHQIRDFARNQRTTFFSPLCAAFVAVLWRLGGREDVVIGTPTANRPTVAHEMVIGPLINSLVLRNRLDPAAGFGVLMQQVQESLLDALAYAEVPFEKVVEALNPERRDDVDPVFQVMFSLEAPLELDPFFADGLRAKPVDAQINTAQLDLTLIVGQNESDRLDLSINYDTALFDARSITLLGQRLTTLLAAAIADPQRPVGELPWQAPAELALLDSWSRRRSPFPEQATVPDFLRGRAGLTPERIAIESGDGALTYGELRERASALAYQLRALGAGPEVPVGLLLDRTLDLPVAVLAVLEAGAAYLPLDPAYPADRLRYVLEDSGARLLLTHGGHADRLGLADVPGCRRVDLAQLPSEARAEAEAAPRAGAANLAYLLYTSGSTGKPKGVAITHRSLINFLVSMAREPGLGPQDVLVAITTLSFDIAALELYLPLFCGARMVLLDRDTAADAAALQAALDRYGATALQATPATWQMLVASGWQGRPGLKALCGGEGLPVALADELLARVGELWNVYGPTEATVWSTARRVLPGAASLLGEKTVSLGQPIANTDIHILDRTGRRQGIGIPGELVIGGDGLARGYWRRPGLTADRFAPDALASRPGARLYRTGDLARWRVDGELEFLGRLDFQVKVRGFRIELGEIESALGSHPGVADRVVVALPGPGGESRLVAYVVPADPAAPPAADELQAFLAAGLPSHMVPGIFVSLPALPLTPNLKVDRKALPPPTTTAKAVASAPRELENEVEKGLHTIFCQVLGLDAVDPGANFFALGGHSLLATRVLARIRDAFGVSLPLRAIFRHPTLAQLAAHLEEELPAPAAPAVGADTAALQATRELEAIAEAARQEAARREEEARQEAARQEAARQEAARREEEARREAARQAEQERAARAEPTPEPPAAPLAAAGGAPAANAPGEAPLSFGQERLWLVSQLGAGASTSYNVTYLTRYRGKLDPDRLERAFRVLIARHGILRTSIALAGGRPVQIVHPEISWRLTVVDLAGGPAEREARARQIETENLSRPFALDQAPLFRAVLLRTAGNETWLNLTFHHLIFDEGSLGAFYQELDALYAASGSGREARLPPPGLQMAELARRQRERLASGALAGELEFWRRELAGSPPLLELPTDRPRPPVASFAGSRYRWTVAEGTRQSLLELRGQTGEGLYPPLLAAFAILLSRLSGARDLVVGTPVTQRDDLELQGLIGFLVHTALLRIGVAESATFATLANAVQDQLLEALEHLELPFEYLVDQLATERSASFNPLFQVMFVFDKGAAGQSSQRLGLPFEDLRAVRLAAHFDLTLVAFDFSGSLELAFDYATDLFDDRTIRAWARMLDRLLELVGQDPYLLIGELPLLAPAAEAALLDASRGPRRLFELGRRRADLFALFERQAAATPEALAVAGPAGDGVSRWTYAELARSAGRIAAEIGARELAPGTPVATVFAGGCWGVAAILGVLEAGCCYVPLDPGAPAERLERLLAAAGAPLLLTESGSLSALAELASAHVAVDLLPARPAPERPRDPSLPAYLIFTSGSSGEPKAVLVGQEAVLNLTHAFAAAHGFRAGQRWLVLPPLHFDASVGDLFPALATGGALVFHPAPEKLDGETLLAFCADERIQVIDTAAALFKGWVDGWRTRGRRNVLPDLEVMMAGGEAVGRDQLAAFSRMQGGRALFYNHYGPTEAAVCATLYRTRDGSELGEGSLPIGRPLANVTTYVVDAQLALQPPGVPGELLIGGAGVALGYLGAPARTAELFLPDPFSDEPGARLYRTGDWVRRRPDGELEFLGRADRQVKLRGYRIELGEVEAQLRRHPAVAEALVVVREDQPGARRLVAYLRLAAPVESGELQRQAQAALPSYMVPAALVTLEAFPLTANGKIDLRALPAPVARDERQPPESGAEQRLAAVWRELLGVDPGRGDDFFEIGGSSILLMQLATRLLETTGRELPLPALFEASRLADMARLIAEPEEAGPAPATPGLDLEAKVFLEPAIWPKSRPLRPVGKRHSLVTGATGFLGAYLIDELLRREQGRVHVLVRAADEDEARRRVRQNLRQYGLWRDDAAFRLEPVPGQLDQPRLGLSAERFAALADTLDVIFHNAATVNFLAPYAKLEAANVRGTEEILRLACCSGAVPVHFVSTLGVFLQRRYARTRIGESDDPDWRGLHQGYEQTKWVAEKLVEAARQRGLPASIHRPARVAGSSRDGAANTADLFYSLIKGCVQLRAAPDLDEPIDLYPVDVLARAIVAISQRQDASGEPGASHHYYNDGTVRFDDLIRSLVRFGLPIRLVPYGEWRQRLFATAKGGEGNALEPFLGLYPAEAVEDRQPSFDQEGTRKLLAAAGIAVPPADEKLLRSYWSFLLRSGFLNPSDARPAGEAPRESNQPELDRV